MHNLSIDPQVLINKVKDSAVAAFSEHLGTNRKVVEEYFNIRHEDRVLLVSLKHGDTSPCAIIPHYEIDKPTDSGYYGILRNYAREVASLIPKKAKKIPKDKWPEPKIWKDNLE